MSASSDGDTMIRTGRPQAGQGGARRRPRRRLAWINVLGGAAVLGSYAHGIATHPGSAGAAWGGVPESLRPLYTVSMLLAAAGYFAFTSFILFRVSPRALRVAGHFGFGLFPLLYLLILVPSALWMPLTFAMLGAPSDALWLAIRAVLALVGLGSLGLVAALLALEPRAPRRHWLLALVGSLAFAFQTAVLDALVWTAFFPA